MLIKIGYRLTYEFYSDTPTYLLLSVRPEYQSKMLSSDAVNIFPNLDFEMVEDSFGNRVTRFLAPPGKLTLSADALIEHDGQPEPFCGDAQVAELTELPMHCFQYLLPSRYCQSDQLAKDAWQLFGQKGRGWHLVQAVRDWVNENVEFGYRHAHTDKTALDVFQKRTGVCRDFSHLCIAMLRAMNVPARYATGYLGDIGVPKDPAPMDFSACFQVFLGGRWHIFDARHNERRIGWILQAVGRDAADCAITTTFGDHKLRHFEVIAEEYRPEPIEFKN